MEAEAARTPEEIRVLAGEALKHGLFLPEGQLKFTLHSAQIHPEAYALAGLWSEGALCGLGLVEKEERRCQAYVLPDFRHCGVGRQAMEAALSASGFSIESLHAHPGIPFQASLRFWRGLGIEVWPANPGVVLDLETLVASSPSSQVVVPLVELLCQDMLGSLLLALPSCEPSPTVAKRLMALMAVAEGSEGETVDFDVRQEWAVFQSTLGFLQVSLATSSGDGRPLLLGESLPLVSPVHGWNYALTELLQAWAVPRKACSPCRF